MTDDRLEIPTQLVRDLIAEQFPQWGDMAVTPVVPGGWNNRSFRLGETMSIRMPSAERYAAQVAKEQHYLPFLSKHLSLPITPAVAQGVPGAGYPFPFGIYGWIEGERADQGTIDNLPAFARDLAAFLREFQRIDTSDGPAPGAHNFHRGGDLAVYDGETRAAIGALSGELDAACLTATWERALASRWEQPQVWVHGDIATGNLLIRDGRLSAVIDFGSMGVGDPACDLAMAWTFFDAESRAAFRKALPFDAATWQRARGWTLWKALITLAAQRRENAPDAEKTLAVIGAIIADDEQPSA